MAVPSLKCLRPGQGFEKPGVVEGVPAEAGGWNEVSFKGPSKPNHSDPVIL